MGAGSLWRFSGEGWIRSGLDLFVYIWRASWKTGRLVWCLLTYLLLTLYVETRRSLGMNSFCAKLARERDVIHVQLFLDRWLLILVHKEACLGVQCDQISRRKKGDTIFFYPLYPYSMVR